jgi:hypothetical protein
MVPAAHEVSLAAGIEEIRMCRCVENSRLTPFLHPAIPGQIFLKNLTPTFALAQLTSQSLFDSLVQDLLHFVDKAVAAGHLTSLNGLANELPLTYWDRGA